MEDVYDCNVRTASNAATAHLRDGQAVEKL